MRIQILTVGAALAIAGGLPGDRQAATKCHAWPDGHPDSCRVPTDPGDHYSGGTAARPGAASITKEEAAKRGKQRLRSNGLPKTSDVAGNLFGSSQRWRRIIGSGWAMWAATTAAGSDPGSSKLTVALTDRSGHHWWSIRPTDVFLPIMPPGRNAWRALRKPADFRCDGKQRSLVLKERPARTMIRRGVPWVSVTYWGLVPLPAPGKPCLITSTTIFTKLCRRKILPGMILTEMVHDVRVVPRMNSAACGANDPVSGLAIRSDTGKAILW